MGGAVGVVLALPGAGGGILAVPLLVFGLHLQMAQAAPVGLLAVGLAASIGALLGLRERAVRYRAALMIGLTGMLFAPHRSFHTKNQKRRLSSAACRKNLSRIYQHCVLGKN